MSILTAPEGATVLRCEKTDSELVNLLPIVDGYIETATGRNWGSDSPISPQAKAAARILLVQWYENPGAVNQDGGSLPAGLRACLVQLEAMALMLETTGIPDDALELVVSAPQDGEAAAAVGVRPLLVFNHPMSSGATSAINLRTAAGITVSTTNTRDATTKRITLTPASALSAATDYEIVITNAADEYGQTLTVTITFRTAG